MNIKHPLANFQLLHVDILAEEGEKKLSEMLKPFPHFEWGLMSGLTEPLWHKESRCSSGSGSSLGSAFQCRQKNCENF